MRFSVPYGLISEVKDNKTDCSFTIITIDSRSFKFKFEANEKWCTTFCETIKLHT
jgi:hypothetical protein